MKKKRIFKGQINLRYINIQPTKDKFDVYTNSSFFVILDHLGMHEIFNCNYFIKLHFRFSKQLLS